MSRSALLTVLMFCPIVSFGQNISVTFTGTGAATQIDSVTATNLKTNESVTLPGNETLVLTVNTGIPTVSELANMGVVYPNPFSGRATFSATVEKPQLAYLKVQNLVGQVVAQTQSYVQPGENEFALSVNAAGIYIVSLTTEQGTGCYKVICNEAVTRDNYIQYLGTGAIFNQNPPQSGMKSLSTGYTIGYTVGDVILYQCRSGIYTTIITDTLPTTKNYGVEFAPCTDADGKNYSIVKIGNQTWMGENLAYLPAVSPSTAGSDTASHYYVLDYDGDNLIDAKAESNYSTYGVLYNWPAAMKGSASSYSVPSGVQGICPVGWHLPSDADWTILSDFLGSNGTKMKATSGWYSNGNGDNSSGFTALPGGGRNNAGGFVDLGKGAYFWSASENSASGAWFHFLDSGDDGVGRNHDYKSGGASVRCVLGTKTAVSVDARIDTTEIGGTGLVLVSNLDGNSPVENGSCNTVVSKTGEQLLMVVDSKDELRGLTLSTPGNSTAVIMDVNAVSTATTIIFLTPGILTTDSLEAPITIQKIQSQPSFGSFATYLANNLPNRSLNAIVRDSTFDALLTSCINEFGTNFGSLKSGNFPGTPEAKNLITFTRQSKNSIDLENYSWRFVAVAERSLNSLDTEVGIETSIPAMDGGIPFSWGSIFRGTAAKPTVETVDYRPDDLVTESEFWIKGPGLKNGSENPSPSVIALTTPWKETIVKFIALPIIDLLSGSDLLEKCKNKAVFMAVCDGIGLGSSLSELDNPLEPAEFLRELTDVTFSIIGAVASGYDISLLKTILKLPSIVITTANLNRFVIHLSNLDQYTKFTIELPAVPVLQSPANNSKDVKIPVTFSWGDCLHAQTYELQISLSTDPNFLTPVYSNHLTEPSKEISNSKLQAGIDYLWQVRSIGDIDFSDWSEVWKFTTANTPPVASFTIDPVSGTTSTVFNFDASGSTDAETPAGELQVRWDWNSSGNWTGYSTSRLATHQYAADGTYTVNMEVKDGGGLTKSITHQVIVSPGNTAPTAAFTISPSSGPKTTNFSFDASGSSDLETPAGELQVRWDWDASGNWTGYSTNKIATHTYADAGTYTVTLEVMDGGGLTETEAKTITVSPASEGNSIERLSANNLTGTLGQPLAGPIQVIVKDKEGKAFAGAIVHFTANNGGSVSQPQVTTLGDGIASVNWTLGATDNSQTLTVRAFKSDNLTHLEGSPLTFTATSVPLEFSYTTTWKDNWKTGGVITFDATGGTLPYQYSINGGSNYASNPEFAGLHKGNYDLKFKDANGNESAVKQVFIHATEFIVDQLVGYIWYPDGGLCRDSIWKEVSTTEIVTCCFGGSHAKYYWQFSPSHQNDDVYNITGESGFNGYQIYYTQIDLTDNAWTIYNIAAGTQVVYLKH